MIRAVLAMAVASLGVSAAADAQVTSNFGYRSDPFHGGKRLHAGMDMAGRVGTPIYATGDGFVRRSRWAGGYGNLVEIEHGYGYQTRFGHLYRSLVAEGQFVRRGQMIALMGSTGRSTGPHLHYEVRINGRAVPPGRFMQIVFQTAPNWSAVRMAAAATASAPAQVAMARRVPQAAAPRAYGRQSLAAADLEISYGGRAPSGAAGGAASVAGIGPSAFGHVSYGTR